jgi:hypothetical protein
MFAYFGDNKAGTISRLPAGFGQSVTGWNNFFYYSELAADIQWGATTFNDGGTSLKSANAYPDWGGHKILVPTGNTTMYDLLNAVSSWNGHIGYY